jgi:hypothetical protein
MRTVPLPEPLRSQLRAIVDDVGEVCAAKRLQVARSTILRAIAGRPVHVGTHAQIRARLEGDA